MAVAIATIATVACGSPSRAEPTPIHYRTPTIAAPTPMPTETPVPSAVPTETPTPTPDASLILTPEPTTIHPWPDQLTEADIDAIFAEVNVPADWRAPMRAIAWCESRYRPGAIGDSCNSLGLMQLWRGWFSPGDDPLDPVTNVRVAVAVRAQRGRFGGQGGWSCADLLNIW